MASAKRKDLCPRRIPGDAARRFPVLPREPSGCPLSVDCGTPFAAAFLCGRWSLGRKNVRACDGRLPAVGPAGHGVEPRHRKHVRCPQDGWKTPVTRMGDGHPSDGTWPAPAWMAPLQQMEDARHPRGSWPLEGPHIPVGVMGNSRGTCEMRPPDGCSATDRRVAYRHRRYGLRPMEWSGTGIGGVGYDRTPH